MTHQRWLQVAQLFDAAQDQPAESRREHHDTSPGLMVSLSAGNDPVKGRPLAKDGAALPPALQTPAPAVRQTIATGETFDFEFEPPARGVAWLDVRRAGGEWVQQVRVTVQ